MKNILVINNNSKGPFDFLGASAKIIKLSNTLKNNDLKNTDVLITMLLGTKKEESLRSLFLVTDRINTMKDQDKPSNSRKRLV